MKMKTLLMAGLTGLAMPVTLMIPAGVAVADAPAKYSTSSTQLGVLMADPDAKAVLQKHIAKLLEGPDVMERASGMTLHELQAALKPYSPDILSDKVLADIDADLAKLPAKG